MSGRLKVRLSMRLKWWCHVLAWVYRRTSSQRIRKALMDFAWKYGTIRRRDVL